MSFRWPRYSLRFLFAAVTLIALGCGWVAIKLQQGGNQREAVKAILDAGGSIGYDFQTMLVPDHPDHFSVASSKLPPQPAWLRKALGDDFFNDVFVASFYNLQWNISESVLQQMTKMPRLRFIYLTNAKIGERKSSISRSIQDEDIPILKQLTELRFLDLKGSKLSKEGFEELSSALPNATILH
jgi:hypothetical protein